MAGWAFEIKAKVFCYDAKCLLRYPHSHAMIGVAL